MSGAKGQDYSPEIPITPLTYEDDHEWLQNVGVAVVDETWLAEANELMLAGSVNLYIVRDTVQKERVVAARSRFFGRLLDCDSADSPLHGEYSRFKDTRPVLLSPSKAVSAMRLMFNMGFEPTDVISDDFSILATKGAATARQLRRRTTLLYYRDSEVADEDFDEGDF